MSKSKILGIISIVTLLELIASVVWPYQITSNNNSLELGYFVIWGIFAVPIIYYGFFIFFLARYTRRDEAKQNIGLVVLLNVLPVIFIACNWTIFK